MTVIAWDGHSLAADGRTTSRSEILPHKAKKIVKVGPQEYIAGAGTTGEIDAFTEAYKSGNPTPRLKESDFVRVKGNRGFVWYSKSTSWSEIRPPYATGSGGQFATGAMLAGATARTAVLIAIERDSGCGLPVQEVKL